jgi:hypothetical protein
MTKSLTQIAMNKNKRASFYVSPPAELRSRKSQCANHCCARHYAPTTTKRPHSQARLQGIRDEHYYYLGGEGAGVVGLQAGEGHTQRPGGDVLVAVHHLEYLSRGTKNTAVPSG